MWRAVLHNHGQTLTNIDNQVNNGRPWFLSAIQYHGLCIANQGSTWTTTMENHDLQQQSWTTMINHGRP